MNADGSNPTNITTDISEINSGIDSGPEWSPDGTKAFTPRYRH